ncbi:hydroxylamine reductase [Peptoniphilus harei]|uniref:Hydroxylamine reductase n=2 Tax=Peptoniphilus harei TaxID=54005 RepID=A0A133PKT8_9FIRM|nr:hydroxylamine reductase [Peptoniphilus harei]
MKIMDMFCYQCQETLKNKGCTKRGVCGKTATVANYQDFLIWISKGLSEIAVKSGKEDKEVIDRVILNLFTTITNANFDDVQIKNRIIDTIELMNSLREEKTYSDAGAWSSVDFSEIDKKIASHEVSILREENEDLRSLKELITYGLKGMAAYARHAKVLGYEDQEVNKFILRTMADLLEEKSLDELIALTLKTGEMGYKAMATLDGANTKTYGNPEISEVNIGARKNPGILVSGHDLKDFEMLLEQAKDSGVDIYTHSEMLPANYYPKFKKYENFVGNYGNAWWKQRDEFESFNGPILMTTNCIVPPKDSYKDKLFTTGAAGYPGCTYIEEDKDGHKDFSKIIELAKTCEPPVEIEKGKIVGGFAHSQVMELADKVIEAVKNGDITKFVVMAGCDGRMTGRNYYEDFAKELPKSTVILTAGCAKYRYNKLNLGDINGIPRVLDAGQCNDSYSLIQIALALVDAFGVESVNDLPIAYNIAWYEQKAVIVLLALLALGVKNIHLGPTLPAFLSKNVVDVLVENFGIAGITSVEEDMKILKIK